MRSETPSDGGDRDGSVTAVRSPENQDVLGGVFPASGSRVV